MNVAENYSSSSAPSPYTENRVAANEWVGHMPKHWNEKRLKNICFLNQRVLTEDTPRRYELQYLDIANVDSIGHTHDIQDFCFEDAPSRARRIVRDGETILSTVRTYLRAMTYMDNPPDNMIVSTGFAVLTAKSGIHPRFLNRLVQSKEFVDRVVAYSDGVAYPAISPTTLSRLPVWVPPFDEQQSIVAFLDRETVRIDEMIAKKQRLIELLEEKRTALISHAVTKGLNPDAPMKDSGIEWLGEIPEHWTVTRLKFRGTVQTGLTLGKRYQGGYLVERPYLRVANVQDGYLDLRDITEVTLPQQDAPRYELKNGDVLMTEGGDYDKLGRGFLWANQIQGCLHQNHVFAVRPLSGWLEPDYLATLMTSYHGKTYFTKTSQQTTNLASTNSTKLGNFPFPLPEVSEQREIMDFVGGRTAALDGLLGNCSEVVQRLQEYRTALISAAVTGKIDVREM